MKNEKRLDSIRDFIGNGEINRVFDELKKLSKEIDDRQLRNHILLNCFSYHKNYNAELLNLQDDRTAINRAVLKTLEFIDEIEERLDSKSPENEISAKGNYEVLDSQELPIEIERKIDVIVEKYFGGLIIDKGDLYKNLSQSAITLEQLEEAIKQVHKHFEFFKKEFQNSSGMKLSNFTQYAIDAVFVPEDKWLGSGNRKRITKEFRELIKKDKKL